MKIIIGLGNPGEQHAAHRHNAGFIALDILQEKWNFPAFKFDKKFNAEISEGNLNNKKIILAKPQTFMNNSGETARKLLDFYKITSGDVIVIHDELDIETGKYKTSLNASSAGHKGAQSVIDYLGTQNFTRIRIGIEGPEKRKERKSTPEDFVLQKFKDTEIKELEKVSDMLSNEIQKLL